MIKKIIGIFLILLASMGLAAENRDDKKVDEFVEIFINNPYSATVQCIVKCDFNNQTGQFDYWVRISIDPDSSFILKVNKKYTHCQVWPKVLFGLFN